MIVGKELAPHLLYIRMRTNRDDLTKLTIERDQAGMESAPLGPSAGQPLSTLDEFRSKQTRAAAGDALVASS